MEYKEIISIIKEPAVTISEETKIPASILIALSVLILDNEEFSTIQKKLLDANNIYAAEAQYTSKKLKQKKVYNDKNKKLYHAFESKEEAIANFIQTNESIFEGMKGVRDYWIALGESNALSDEQKEQLLQVIEDYKLNEYDILISDSTEVNTEVEKLDSSSNTDTITEVKDIIEKINPDMKKEEPAATVKLAKPIRVLADKKADHKLRSSLCKAGTKIHALRTNLYKTIYDKIPTRSITGDYYLYSGVEKYQRYAIVAKKEFVGDSEDFIIGYIDYDEFDIIEE